jgi:hypothetical protein
MRKEQPSSWGISASFLQINDSPSKSDSLTISSVKDTNLQPNPLDKQIAGDHYKKLKIQPVTYIQENGIGYMEGNVIKYVTRWKDKNGLADLEKAKHYLEMLIAFNTNETK